MRDVRADPSLPYAAHTRGRNSWSIGLSVAAMRDATPADFGAFPLTEPQLEALCRVAARLARFYAHRRRARSAPTPRPRSPTATSVPAADEVRWDIARLRPVARAARSRARRPPTGDWFRTRIADLMEDAPVNDQGPSTSTAAGRPSGRTKIDPPALVILIRHAEKPGESKGHAVSDDDIDRPQPRPAGLLPRRRLCGVLRRAS